MLTSKVLFSKVIFFPVWQCSALIFSRVFSFLWPELPLTFSFGSWKRPTCTSIAWMSHTDTVHSGKNCQSLSINNTILVLLLISLIDTLAVVKGPFWFDCSNLDMHRFSNFCGAGDFWQQNENLLAVTWLRWIL